MKNMTALVSCFARAYHYKNNRKWVFRDSMADKLLSGEEYNAIASNFANGISYFNPLFKGTDKEALRYVVDNQLSPSVLARSAFCEQSLEIALMLGCSQYVIFASGYDTFSLRSHNTDLRVYELDRCEMIEDKKRRIQASGLKEKCKTTYIPCDLSQKEWIKSLIDSGFDPCSGTFASLLGISYYMKKEDFSDLLRQISSIWSDGSSICFDYPVFSQGAECRKNRELAKAANEDMEAKYSYGEIEKMLESCGFLIYEHHNGSTAAIRFFEKYNLANPKHRMTAPKGVNYCLAVKKES